MAKSDETATVNVSASGNCKGELKQLHDEPGRAYHRYECQSCHQIVTVGLEDLEANGMPPEHSPTPAEE